jgi:hypothetical protein
MKAIHTLTPYFSKTHFNIFLQAISSFQAFNENVVRSSPRPHARYMPCPCQPPLFDHPNNIWRMKNYGSLV